MDDKKKKVEKEKPMKEGLYGISEAPKDHPDNENGNLKVITE